MSGVHQEVALQDCALLAARSPDLRLRLSVGKLCPFGVGWSVALMITRRSG